MFEPLIPLSLEIRTFLLLTLRCFYDLLCLNESLVYNQQVSDKMVVGSRAYKHMPRRSFEWRLSLFVSHILQVLVNHLVKLLADVWRPLLLLFRGYMVVLVEGIIDLGRLCSLSTLLELSHLALRVFNSFHEIKFEKFQY